MRILITGSTGFVGSHLIPKLIDNHEVFALARYVTGRLNEGLPRDILHYFCDVRDFDAVKRTIREIQPEVVIHLAACSPQSYSYDHPHEVLDTNLMGTINLAEACRREVPHFQHFLFAGSAEEYGDNGILRQKEDSPRIAVSPYSVAKIAADNYLNYLWKAYKFPITILRNTNTYGRKKDRHFVVEKTIIQALQGEEIRLGDPTTIRDFEYIDDHVSSYLSVLNQSDKAVGETFNFGTEHGCSISQMVEIVADLTGFRGNIVWNTVPRRPLDIQTLVMDTNKARAILGWAAEVPLNWGLKFTVDYWKTQL